MIDEIKAVLEKHKDHIPVVATAELLAVLDVAEEKAKHTYENCHNLTCRRKCQKDGYNMAIDEFAEKFVFQAVCQGCSGCCNCYELGRQMQCGEYQRYMEIAEQLKEE